MTCLSNKGNESINEIFLKYVPFCKWLALSTSRINAIHIVILFALIIIINNVINNNFVASIIKMASIHAMFSIFDKNSKMGTVHLLS